jgi:hypothetical protein
MMRAFSSAIQIRTWVSNGRVRLSLQGTLSDSVELVAGDARHWGDGMNNSISGNGLTKHC